jgi:hypothetical protein
LVVVGVSTGRSASPTCTSFTVSRVATLNGKGFAENAARASYSPASVGVKVNG